MSNTTKKRSLNSGQTDSGRGSGAFVPCSQDMTICGDCEKNRASNNCPRLKEWMASKWR